MRQAPDGMLEAGWPFPAGRLWGCDVEDFRVAAVQMNAVKGDLEANLEAHDRLAREAAGGGCRMVLFPELGVTGHYGDEAVTEFAEEVARGRIFDRLSSLAAELGIVISYGICEKAHGTHYNTQVLVDVEGLVGVQRKIHASRDEYFHFRMGRSLEVLDLGFARVGTLVCFDSNFFELWRVLALKGADVVLLPHASRSGWGKEIPEAEQLESLRKTLDGLPGRYGRYAEDNSVYAVFANQAGYNGHSTHSGGAYVLGPRQSVLARTEPRIDELWVSADLAGDALEEARRKNAVMRCRRPEVYGEIARMI